MMDTIHFTILVIIPIGILLLSISGTSPKKKIPSSSPGCKNSSVGIRFEDLAPRKSSRPPGGFGEHHSIHGSLIVPDSRQKDQAKCLTVHCRGHRSCLKIFRNPSLKLKQTTSKILSLHNLLLTHSNSWINSSTWTFFSPLGSNYFFQDSSGLHLPKNSKSFWPSAAFVASLDVRQLSGNMRVIANKATICDSRRLSQQQFVVQIFYQKIWRAACTSDYKLKPHSTKKITSHRFRNLHFNLENFKSLAPKCLWYQPTMWLRSQELLPRLPAPQTRLIQICSKDFSENIEFCLDMFFYPSVSSKLVFAWPDLLPLLALAIFADETSQLFAIAIVASELGTQIHHWSEGVKFWVANDLWINNENESMQWIPFFLVKISGMLRFVVSNLPLTATIQDFGSESFCFHFWPHCALSLADPRGLKLEARIFCCGVTRCSGEILQLNVCLKSKCFARKPLGYDSNSLASNIPAKCYLLEASTSSTGARKVMFRSSFEVNEKKRKKNKASPPWAQTLLGRQSPQTLLP